MTQNRQILIADLPKGKLGPEHFRLQEAAIPQPADGEVLLRARYLQIDAAMRAWMLGPTYRAALKAGDVMAGSGLAEVVESRDPSLRPGDLVFAETGWQDYAALPAAGLVSLERMQPLTYLLSVYGVAGLTAYLGLMEVGQPQPGETVVVSAAAGGVGILAGQIARLHGCRVVGVARGQAKCDTLVNEFGFDAAVNFKPGAPLYPTLMEATHGGTDVFFDNVGGDVFEAALFTMKPGGRLIACGVVSAYDADPIQGLQAVRGVPAWFISRRLTLRGFIVSDFYRNGRREAALAQLKSWVDAGKLKVREDIIEGFEQLPAALIGLLAGENIGKRIVKV